MVAVPGGPISNGMKWHPRGILLLSFRRVSKFEDIYVQGLLMLAHLAKHDSSRFVEVWVCTQYVSVTSDASEILTKTNVPSFDS